MDTYLDGLASDADVLDRVARWLGPVDVRTDRSQPHGEARVLELAPLDGRCAIAKWHRADRNYDREVLAYERNVPSLGSDAPQLIAHDDTLRLVLVTRAPGDVVAGTDAAHDPDVHRQAGALIRRLHESDRTVRNSDYGAVLVRKFDRWSDRAAQLIEPDDLAAAERIVLGALDLPELEHVPAHRDNSPRNWVIDEGGRVRLIDFAALEYEPWCIDLFRMSQREWLDAPHLREAFLDGYGRQPDELDERMLRSFHALGAVTTIAWATEHGDAAFAQEGREMLERVLGRTLY
ncbi:phosphotransferase [Diaminobutyricimonas aerilata]|uniref:phosphotransferase n=1 Tax=Diaminobutyricimonas aerilata TaxID=1162967 RepID=UPI000C24DBED|nr:phosphotransferase [Diaminobutyricimonas aerilata]